MKYILHIVILIAMLLSSCIDDNEWYELNNLKIKYDTSIQNYIKKQDGVFIVNEGNFMYDNASLSYYMIDSMKVLNEVFLRTNATPLGDVGQSMTIQDSLGYIVMNNSSKIYVINLSTFEYIGKITGLVSPRYIHFIDINKAYVSDLYSKSISIVDPVNLSITGYIDIGIKGSAFNRHSSENFIRVNNRVFTNSWSFDNKILVIDILEDQLIDSIDVPLQPNSMVLDKHQKLWVLCDGGFAENPAGNEIPELIRINTETLSIEKRIKFDLEVSPTELSINGKMDTLYFLNTHVYSFAIEFDSIPQVLIESSYKEGTVGGFYGLGIDPYSGDIYVADAIDQVQRGIIYRYTSTGAIVDTFKAGVNPGNFCFKAEEK